MRWLGEDSRKSPASDVRFDGKRIPCRHVARDSCSEPCLLVLLAVKPLLILLSGWLLSFDIKQSRAAAPFH